MPSTGPSTGMLPEHLRPVAMGDPLVYSDLDLYARAGHQAKTARVTAAPQPRKPAELSKDRCDFAACVFSNVMFL